jgi:hypothetical protein
MKKEYDFTNISRSQLWVGNSYKDLLVTSSINKIVNFHLHSQENLGSEGRIKNRNFKE